MVFDAAPARVSTLSWAMSGLKKLKMLSFDSTLSHLTRSSVVRSTNLLFRLASMFCPPQPMSRHESPIRRRVLLMMVLGMTMALEPEFTVEPARVSPLMLMPRVVGPSLRLFSPTAGLEVRIPLQKLVTALFTL